MVQVRKLRDFFYSLRQPRTTPPIYEKRSDRMAEIARSYHEELQKDNGTTDQERRQEEINDVLENINVTIPDCEKSKLEVNISPEEV